jgi:hypothetical protein
MHSHSRHANAVHAHAAHDHVTNVIHIHGVHVHVLQFSANPLAVRCTVGKARVSLLFTLDISVLFHEHT